MTQEDEYRRRAEGLLKLAAGADNMRERGRLIDEAMHWHNRALDLHGGGEAWANDNDDADDAEATA
ncbi:MAG TPA: hypothetical protein VFH92_07415 [Phenylobacterium sp.]|nr:hypothetical protein [Phenylobacterium sp.]